MGLFSKTGLFGKIWSGIKKGVTVAADAIADVFKDVQLEFLPEAVVITQDLMTAVTSGLVEDVVEALNPVLGGLPEDILNVAKSTLPKVLAAELGLQALGENPTAD